MLDVTAGTATASKAVVLGASKEIATITTATITTLNATNIDAGASGTAGSVDVFPATASRGKLSITAANQTGDTTVNLNVNAMGQATTVNLPDPGVAASYVVQSTAALTLAQADVLNGALSTQPIASKAVIADASQKIGLAFLGGAASASGLLMGVGTSGSPATSAVADAKFLEIRAKTTATSGDNRLAYFRYDIGGIGASGESLRSFTDLTAAATNAHGAHFSLQAKSTGYISGQGIGMRGQLYIDNSALPAYGTYYGAQSEIYCAGSSSSMAAVTKTAIHSFIASGDQTGAATILNMLSFDGVAASGITAMISSTRLAELPANSVGIAVLINGTRYYIPAVLDSEYN